MPASTLSNITKRIRQGDPSPQKPLKPTPHFPPPASSQWLMPPSPFSTNQINWDQAWDPQGWGRGAGNSLFLELPHILLFPFTTDDTSALSALFTRARKTLSMLSTTQEQPTQMSHTKMQASPQAKGHHCLNHACGIPSISSVGLFPACIY